MATISPPAAYTTAPRDTARAAATVRDPRLDFFRGIAMYIILIAHIPGNPWTGWIPARFGFSDATEIFVFCSGMASAIAFGGAFARRGWALGSARVMYRVWQVYWAHLGLFFFVAMSMALLTQYGGGKDYIGSLNLHFFFNETAQQLVGLFTLTYVPNYFDILPMYLVVLAMMPVVMALAVLSRWAVAVFVVAVWLGASAGLLSFPAEPWSDREWFFNPFGWQLLFFTGFAFMIGWLPPPPVSKPLIALAVAYVVLSAPIGSWKVFLWVDGAFPDLGETLRAVWREIRLFQDDTGFSVREKTDFGVLRYVHFLALAYLAWLCAGAGGRHLTALAHGAWGAAGRLPLAVISKVGQQSLAVFVTSMALARLLGFVLDQTGRDGWPVVAVNLGGFVLISATAYGVGWFKTQPWRSKRP